MEKKTTKAITLILVLLLSNSMLIAQNLDKLDLFLREYSKNELMLNSKIDILVQGDIRQIQSIIEQHGGDFKYFHGDIACIKVLPATLIELERSTYVQRIERPNTDYVALNDSMRSTIHVNAVHAGVPPLLTPYTGNGIAIGIIDTGVDLTHPDLQDSTGATRVKFVWDQRKPVSINTPQPFGYGQEWDENEINAGNAQTNDEQGYGHGTHVSGIAAGDGSANGKNKGIAPDAVLIEVAIDFNNSSSPTVLDAVNYIFTKAQQLGLPCIINASLGTYYGSHDGRDLQSLMIKNMIISQPGRTLVAAAGNAGNVPFHLGYQVTSDTSFTWIRHNTSYPYTYLQIWGDTAVFSGINFAVGSDANNTDPSFRGRTAFRNFSYCQGVARKDTIFSIDGNRLAIVDMYGSTQGPARLLEMIIRPDSTTFAWRLMSTGAGRFDLWKFYDGTLQSGFQTSNLPSTSTVPDMVNYKLPDLNSTIVSGFQCLDEVITVGNHFNRTFYYDFAGNIVADTTAIPGNIVPNSSKGPTRDGRIKPDICAPGSTTLSAGQLSLLTTWQTLPAAIPLVAQGGFHFRDGGTSSAAPVVAGVAALFQEQNPGASFAQVKNAVIQCAVQDSLTGNQLPNNTWGAGKTDALNTLINCALTSLSESSQLPSFYVAPNPIIKGDDLLVYSNSQSVTVEILDMAGKIVINYSKQNKWPLGISTQSLNSGFYLVKLTDSKGMVSTKKFAVIAP
ncbi:MAG: S8 family peptidase [Bacteroidota bacterium]